MPFLKLLLFFYRQAKSSSIGSRFLINMRFGKRSETMVKREKGEKANKFSSFLNKQPVFLDITHNYAQKMCMGKYFNFFNKHKVTSHIFLVILFLVVAFS